MVALSFKVFRDKLMSREKTQTIRPYSEKRYEQIKRIKKLQIYWKQRTKECEKLFDAELVEVFRIRFDLEFSAINWKLGLFELRLNVWRYDEGRYLTDEEKEELARLDGFKYWGDLVEWFINEYGFEIDGKKFMVIRFRRV